ncbi:MAG TPA: putative Ig domain-containing protein, partial [Myxococcota bacterium]|nr:putative Ig domain-containing protein [Myxococcota bacterium]
RAGVSLWTFNEREGSTEFADLFGTRWPLLLSKYEHGLPQSGIATRFGHGLRFAGTNPLAQTLILPRELAPITPPLTLAFWFQLGETSKLTSVLASGNFAKDGIRMGLVPRPNATLVGAWTTQSGGSLELLFDANIQVGDWHHLAFTYDGTTAVLYVDGKRVATQDGPRILPPATGGYMLQGGSSTSQQTFQGMVDELLVADSVLTDDEISLMVTSYLRSGMFTLIDGGNAPVMASIPDMSVRAGETLEVAVPVFDADYDLEVITAAPMPSGATLDSVTRTFRWTPGFQQTGVYPVTLAAFDRRQHLAVQSFNIRVLPATPPDPTALFRYSIPSTAYPARQPQRIQILTGAPGGLGREGVHIMLANASDPAAPLRIVGLHGEEVYAGPFGVLPLLPTGHYFVETPGDRTQLLILPSSYAGSSFMGTMADRPDDLEARSRSAVLQATWRRLGSQITWADIERTRGKYDWSQLDSWIAANRVNGAKALIILVDAFPAWLRGASEEVFVAEVTRYARD